MTILKASRLKAVLDKARNAGQVEETVTIAGLDVVLRSLASEAYNDILEELAEVPENSYPACYQIEHVCRSLVEIDGQDLRDVDYIEAESESGSVKLERHQWVRDNIVSTWSREMVQVAFHKVMDAIAGAEAKATEGVQFRVESETDEEKFRRFLNEAKEVGGDIPDELRAAILKENGLLEGTSLAELAELETRARTWVRGPEGSDGAPDVDEDAGIQSPPRAPVQVVHAASSTIEAVAPEPTPSAAELMARRTPLNRTAIQEPAPKAQPEFVPSIANKRSPPPPPDKVHTISSRYAAIEGVDADAPTEPQYMPGQSPFEGGEPIVIDQRRPPVDREAAQTILDKPPMAGSNAKYSPRAGAGLNPRNR
jgi:hypothetical protein